MLALSLLVVGCGPAGSASSEATPWAEAPEDGTWPTDTWRDKLPFGSVSRPSDRLDYVFGIATPPTLTTADSGQTVTITSELAVERVTEKWPDTPVSDDLPIFWSPGELAPEHAMDESWGTHNDAACAPDALTAGQIATCRISFTAHASEIQNSYWVVEDLAVGTWPSQRG